MYVYTLVLLLSSVLVCEADRNCQASHTDPHHEIRLHMNLSCISDNSYRPVKHLGTAVSVTLRFDLKYMTFDEDKATVTLLSWIVFNWKDESLTWNVSDYGGVEELPMESHNMWSPILTVLNADVSVYTPNRVYTTCLITSDGAVTCVPQLAHTAICSTSLRNWPYDKRNCTLYYASWMQTEDKVNLSFHEKNPIVFKDFQTAPGWKLLDIIHGRVPGQRTCCPYNDPVLTISFILERQAAGLTATVLIPSLVLVLLTCFSLLITFNIKTRLFLICFSLFGHFVLISQVCFLLPKLSSETPNILLFIRNSVFLTLLCVWESLSLMYFIRRLSPAPSWVSSVNSSVMDGPAKYLVITNFDAGRRVDDDVTDCRPHNIEWIKFVNIINSCVFMVCVLLYLLLMFIYCPVNN